MALLKPSRERFYRRWINRRDLISFQVQVKETDLFILAQEDLRSEITALVLSLRSQIESYIQRYPLFLESLAPLPSDPLAPPIVQKMLAAGLKAGVGPMAAVAGAIAEAAAREAVARGLTQEIFIENGGDCFLMGRQDLIVAIYAGKSPFSGRLGLKIPAHLQPLSVCTSSGKIGHSLSLGQAEAVTVLAKEAALADAAATAIGNVVRKTADIPRALKAASQIPDLLGVVVIIGDRIGAQGKALELVALD
ncbi:UPF0280 family protein [Thermosulfuriphilus ammonigenes]|uniref:UPF0280 family protein n=1 Tax=Thermosulfuriphilus ammonigenes TaxID=1936021 RepID=A0A6G7PWW0_9BACT|nr:UPF0280 family protein [Thermosulfuriphilus ammonigenes]MBA2847863.1 hypothetical protein [Thermosulfuriphilus ammonigenes]QIJ71938.1 UPF0280 family protein [Thermosulfuriphilus ammonigenes]HFB83590.1 UPF0280 family protein [Thermodesulfatator sp.]